MKLCEGDRQEEKEVEDSAKPIDPLLQLITLFSRSALTERWCVCVCVSVCLCVSMCSLNDHMQLKPQSAFITGQTHHWEGQYSIGQKFNFWVLKPVATVF